MEKLGKLTKITTHVQITCFQPSKPFTVSKLSTLLTLTELKVSLKQRGYNGRKESVPTKSIFSFKEKVGADSFFS